MNFEKLLETKEYEFLKTDSHLGEKIILLGLGGSYAYGTNIETSDVDIRGIALNSKSDLIGMSNFEQRVNESTDTTIYAFNKIIGLLLNTNPNTIEMLGLKQGHYLFLSPIGQELLDNKKLFLSKRCIYSFGGYANQQLRRLQNAIARDTLTQTERETHILNTIKNMMFDIKSRYEQFENGSIKLYIDKAIQEDIDTEIFMDINLTHYPLRDYKSIWSEMNNVVKDYSKIGKRNNKKDELHLNKHCMHLIRLYMMCLDILEKEEINTYRDKEHDLLMSIRNGEYMHENGTMRQEFWDLLNEYEKKFEYAKENTSLPDNPDYKNVEEFVMSVNERVIKDEI
ncbi:nucleotidyltransferase domain-containing protein [Anaerocolumna aminovalerica]|uniref:DNA polymerase beta superfamily protein n=1 Tax=Anaerocolumna aminovalerica TaxID=1527 RepID=UPI001C0EF906|nr:nucleotidyltransferase domain-containing protein [Anaerocolumna aminovalerica]MBU5331682.1 nucleotidyltransferase domain-containing protein [Anaerocolumna aminovalerica]